MEKKNKRTLILSVIICLLPMVLGIAFYNRLPEQMPIHFTINDVPDNYAPKNFALFTSYYGYCASNMYNIYNKS